MVIVPELAAVLGALFAAIVVYAIVLLAKGLAGLFPTDIPILSTIHRVLYNIALIGGAAISWIMADVIRPLINAIVGPILGFLRMIDGLVGFAGNMAQSWLWLLNTALPRILSLASAAVATALRTAKAYTFTLVHNLAAAVLHDIALARAYSVSLVHSLATAVLHDIALAKAYSVALVHGLAADVTKDIGIVYHDAVAFARAGDAALGRALHNLAGTVAGIEATSLALVKSEVAAGIKVAEQYALGQATRAITIVDAGAAAGIAAVAPIIITDVGQLVDVIGTDLPDIGAAVRAIPKAVPTDLTDTIAMVGALAVPMIRYMRDCGIPNCRNLSKMGRDLADLTNVFAAGALIAALAEMVADPEGAAHDTIDVAGGLLSDGVDAAKGLLGVG